MQEKIIKIEWARLIGQRPRKAGCNARLGEHGSVVRSPLARVTTDRGTTGFGWSWINEEQAQTMVGLSPDEIFGHNWIVREPYRALEYPLYDLAGKLAGKPVYALLGGQPDADGLYRVPCYDTSLYFDDLHLDDDDEAADLIASEALEGVARGHRNFKLKVGRGAMHMPLEAGTRRDIRIIQAVREAVGPDSADANSVRLMIDANNGYNINLVKQVLSETADANVYWIEEAFHEDPRLYAYLKDWLTAEGLNTLIADGEGGASPRLLDWVQQGLIDVVQYDARQPGFAFWLELGPQLDAWGARSAPHNYGDPFGNYASGHLAAVIQGFESVEWDEASVDGLDASAYVVVDGCVQIPNLPGYGLSLDEKGYAQAVGENGFVVE